MSVIHGPNYGTPTLDLNFAKNKSLIDTISGSNLVTFTRSSTGTYVDSDGLIKTAAANEPRFDHDPVTGECLGLLVEEARTNLFTYSSDITQASWNRPRSSESIGGTAPDGTNTANDVTVVASGFNGSVNKNLTLSGTYTHSVFVKKKGFSIFRLGFTTNAPDNVYWNIDTNTFSNQGTNVISASSQKLSNGWYRISVTYNIASSAVYGVQVFVVDNPGNTYTTVNSTNGFYMWGAQLEAGTFPTSYIPTTGSTVTRSADVAQMTGTNFSSWWNASSGSFLFAHKSPNTPSTSTYFYLITAGGGSTTNGYRITSLVIPADGGGANAWSSTASWLTTGLAANESARLAFGFANGSAATIKNGAVQETNTENLAAVSPTTLSMAANVTSTVSRLTYYPTRLQDFQLQQLTK